MYKIVSISGLNYLPAIRHGYGNRAIFLGRSSNYRVHIFRSYVFHCQSDSERFTIQSFKEREPLTDGNRWKWDIIPHCFHCDTHVTYCTCHHLGSSPDRPHSDGLCAVVVKAVTELPSLLFGIYSGATA